MPGFKFLCRVWRSSTCAKHNLWSLSAFLLLAPTQRLSRRFRPWRTSWTLTFWPHVWICKINGPANDLVGGRSCCPKPGTLMVFDRGPGALSPRFLTSSRNGVAGLNPMRQIFSCWKVNWLHTPILHLDQTRESLKVVMWSLRSSTVTEMLWGLVHVAVVTLPLAFCHLPREVFVVALCNHRFITIHDFSTQGSWVYS